MAECFLCGLVQSKRYTVREWMFGRPDELEYYQWTKRTFLRPSQYLMEKFGRYTEPLR